MPSSERNIRPETALGRGYARTKMTWKDHTIERTAGLKLAVSCFCGCRDGCGTGRLTRSSRARSSDDKLSSPLRAGEPGSRPSGDLLPLRVPAGVAVAPAGGRRAIGDRALRGAMRVTSARRKLGGVIFARRNSPTRIHRRNSAIESLPEPYSSGRGATISSDESPAGNSGAKQRQESLGGSAWMILCGAPS